MKFEEDYVMRMIKDMVKALACVVFGKRFTEYEVEEEKADDTDFLYRDIIEMADRGKINEAETYFSRIWTGRTKDTWKWP